MDRGVFGIVAVFFLAVGAPHSQAPTPPRDRPAAPSDRHTGTAAIRGRIIDGETAMPIVRARVRLWGGEPSTSASAFTDEFGAFVFNSLPHGSYTMWADKPTYISAQYPDPAARTIRTIGHPIVLADGQAVEGVRIAMFHGGVIAGRIVDPYGDPAEMAMVQALRLPKDGREGLMMRGGSQTNDIGEFRISHLQPGKYVIAVIPPRDVFTESAALGSTKIGEPQPAPTFYPGVQSIEQAQTVGLERGRSASGLNFALVNAPSATVTGFLVDANGQPAPRNGSISIRPVLAGLPESGFGQVGNGLGPDGTFRLRVPVGEYEIEAYSSEAGPNSSPSEGREQFGRVRLSVNGDMSGIEIPLGYGATISGQVIFDGTSALPTLQSDSRWFQVLSPPRGKSSCRMGRSTLNPDFSFTIKEAFGTCGVVVNGPFDPWQPKAVVHDGMDILDETVSFASGEHLKDVQVILTDRRTEIVLQVIDDRSQPTREFVALLFPVDRKKWTEGSRYLHSYVPREEAGSSRADHVMTVPPSEYFAVAVDDADPDVLQDADALERLSRAARRIALVEGAKVDVTLRRIKLSDFVADR